MWNRITKCFKVRVQHVFKPSLRKKYVNINLKSFITVFRLTWISIKYNNITRRQVIQITN